MPVLCYPSANDVKRMKIYERYPKLCNTAHILTIHRPCLGARGRLRWSESKEILVSFLVYKTHLNHVLYSTYRRVSNSLYCPRYLDPLRKALRIRCGLWELTFVSINRSAAGDVLNMGSKTKRVTEPFARNSNPTMVNECPVDMLAGFRC